MKNEFAAGVLLGAVAAFLPSMIDIRQAQESEPEIIPLVCVSYMFFGLVIYSIFAKGGR